jgi:hypothetical protein
MRSFSQLRAISSGHQTQSFLKLLLLNLRTISMKPKCCPLPSRILEPVFKFGDFEIIYDLIHAGGPEKGRWLRAKVIHGGQLLVNPSQQMDKRLFKSDHVSRRQPYRSFGDPVQIRRERQESEMAAKQDAKAGRAMGRRGFFRYEPAAGVDQQPG